MALSDPYMDGSIPSIAEEYHEIEEGGNCRNWNGEIAREYPRKGRVKEKQTHGMGAELEYAAQADDAGLNRNGRRKRKDNGCVVSVAEQI